MGKQMLIHAKKKPGLVSCFFVKCFSGWVCADLQASAFFADSFLKRQELQMLQILRKGLQTSLALTGNGHSVAMAAWPVSAGIRIIPQSVLRLRSHSIQKYGCFL